VLGYSVVHQQVFHFVEIGGGAVASPLEITSGILQKPFSHPVEQILAPESLNSQSRWRRCQPCCCRLGITVWQKLSTEIS